MCNKPTFKKVIDFAETKQLLEQIRQDRGYPSGYADLDRLCGGLVRDGVTLIAGRPAMGTTSLACNIVNRLSQKQDGTILIFSAKIWSDEITTRLLSLGTGLIPEDLLNNRLPKDMLMAKFFDYYSAKKSTIKIDRNTLLYLDDIWDHCCRTPNLQLVVIDSVDAICKPIDFSAETARWDEKEPPETIFRSLQKLAHNLSVPVLCTTHVHRSLERRKNKRPRLDDLKKIGIPAELVDQIIFLYRDRYYDPEGEEGAEWIVAKACQGDVGTVRLDWDNPTRRFIEKSSDA